MGAGLLVAAVLTFAIDIQGVGQVLCLVHKSVRIEKTSIIPSIEAELLSCDSDLTGALEIT